MIPPGPPTGVANLHNTTYQPNLIRWTWNDPGNIDFTHVEIYLDGEFQENVTAGSETWTATGLTPSTTYTIGTRTVGAGDLVNETWVNHTATTNPLSISHLDPSGVIEGSPGFTLNVYGTGFGGSCSVFWNGDEQPTQFLDPGHMRIQVLPEMIYQPGLMGITVHDSTTGEVSNSVVFCVRDLFAGAHAWKFRSDSSNSGVYDDGGTRPEGELIWNYTTGGLIYSSPAVVNGVIYIGSRDNNFYALDASTGELIWNFETGYHVYSSPAVTNGVVYVGSCDKNLYALDASTGAPLWNFETGEWVDSSPTVADGVVYCGSGDRNLYALNAATGKLIWNYTTGKWIESSPAVANGVVYCGSDDRNLYALDAATGALLWNYTTGKEIESSPAVADGVVYVGSYDRNLYALDAATGALLWNYTTGNWIESSPSVADGMVYVGCDDGTLYALDASTGILLWSFATGKYVTSSPAVANGVVYCASNDGILYALDAATGALFWSYPMGSDAMLWSSPAVADGMVYVGCDDGNLYALGTLPLDPPVTDFSANVTSGNAPLDVEFTDTSTGVVTTRFWDFGDGATEWANGSLSVSHTYPFPGTYNVSLTAANADAGDTETKTGYIQVSPVGAPPRALFTVSPFFGYGPLTVGFRDRSTGAPTAWKWDFGDGNTSSEQTPTHTYMTVGRYSPTLTVSNSGGSSSYSFSVWVRERPVIPTYTPVPTFTTKPTIPPLPGRSPIAFFAINTTFGYAPMSVQFTDMSFHAPASWQWNFGDGHASTLQNPVNTYTESGTYSVSLTATNAYGESTTSRRVYVR